MDLEVIVAFVGFGLWAPKPNPYAERFAVTLPRTVPHGSRYSECHSELRLSWNWNLAVSSCKIRASFSFACRPSQLTHP